MKAEIKTSNVGSPGVYTAPSALSQVSTTRKDEFIRYYDITATPHNLPKLSV